MSAGVDTPTWDRKAKSFYQPFLGGGVPSELKPEKGGDIDISV